MGLNADKSGRSQSGYPAWVWAGAALPTFTAMTVCPRAPGRQLGLGPPHFDTAALYAAGESERRFGACLPDRPRQDYALSTKLGRCVRDGREIFDYTATGAEASLDASIRRLGGIVPDIVFIHDLTRTMHGQAFERQFATTMNGAYTFLDRLRAQGVIRAVGIAMADAAASLRFAEEARIDCFILAGAYTLLVHASLDTLLAHCALDGSAVLVAAPFNTGILATGAIRGARFGYKPASADLLVRIAAIEAVCRPHRVRLPAAALQFPLAHPAVVSVVAGHQSPAEVQANLGRLAEPIPPEFWYHLKAAGLFPASAPTP